jgi:hypothetical protein
VHAHDRVHDRGVKRACDRAGVPAVSAIVDHRGEQRTKIQLAVT